MCELLCELGHMDVVHLLLPSKLIVFVFIEYGSQARSCAAHSCTAVRAEATHLSEDGAITAHCRVAHSVVDRPFG